MRRLAIGLLGVMVVAMACGRARPPAFEERHWRLVELDGQTVRRDGDERVGRVRGWTIADGRLGLLAADGSTLAVFVEAAPPRHLRGRDRGASGSAPKQTTLIASAGFSGSALR